MKELVVATKNRGKLEEFQRIFGELGVRCVGADGLELPDVVEDGATFSDNALKKAREVALGTGRLTLADDSGLEVDSLGGAPGVYSARYAGDAGAEANVRKLLGALEQVPDGQRTARFRCVLALVRPSGDRVEIVGTAEGRCEGSIARTPSGDRGFGYDPIFVPAGHTCTMAELDAAEKDALSHRGSACRAMRDALAAHLARDASGDSGAKRP